MSGNSLRFFTPASIQLFFAAYAWSQGLQITTPTNGATYSAGDAINVTVNVQGSYLSVTVIGQDIGTAPLLQTAPYIFSLTAPNETVGPKTLTAVGFTAPGVGVFSTPVTINIVSRAALVDLKPNLTSFRFRYIGQQVRISVLGTFGNGSAADVSKSSGITYTSGNPNIVNVSSDGTLRASGQGQTNVLIAYGTISKTVAVTVVQETSAPSIAGLPGTSCKLWPPNHELVQVATISAAAASGVNSFDVVGTSNELSDPQNPDIVITGDGIGPRVVYLRADRLGGGTGRIYTLTATAISNTDAITISTATCTVPHDQSH
jgi:hypothetical protein